MAPAAMLNDDMMELVLLALLFVVVRDHRVVDMVNNTLLSVMPDLQLEDENGEPTLIQNGTCCSFCCSLVGFRRIKFKSLN